MPLYIKIFSIQQVLRSRCNYLGQTLEFVDYMEVAVSSISGWCLHTSDAFQSSPSTKEVTMMFTLQRHLNNQGHIWYWQWCSTIDGDLYFVHLSFEFRILVVIVQYGCNVSMFFIMHVFVFCIDIVDCVWVDIDWTLYFHFHY